MQLHNIQLADGVGFLPLPDTRFKTACLTVACFVPLRDKTAAEYAVLSELISGSSAKYPSLIALHRHLSRLYGAGLSSGTLRCGENQVLFLSASCLKNRFALQGENLTASMTDLVLDLLFDPHLTDGVFDPEDVAREKRCLLERIAGEINNKRAYAKDGCDRLLANGEPYGVSVNGTKETANALTPDSITKAWKRLLETAQFQWFYLGEDSGDAVAERIQKAFENRSRGVNAGQTITAYTSLSAPRRETVKMQVNQAKLVMGFRIPATDPNREVVMTARLLSALWGGSPQSLLFRQVREKMGLCYYCQTGYDRLKGVLTVDSGVDASQVALAETAILEQLDRIKNGDFSEETFEDTRRYLINSYKDTENLQSSLIRWYLGQTMNPPFYSPKTCIEEIKAVTKEEVIELANKVSFDSVYTILPEEETE